ncbi:MAG: hypothetical protein ABI760_15990 [Ferruginibacter sp.]
MKNFQRSVLTLSVIFALTSTDAQTVDEIIAKHVEAIGGKEKLSSITSLHLENTMRVMGNDAPSNSTLLIGKGFRSESEYNGQKMIQVITDKGGWSINPMSGGTDPQPINEDQYKAAKDQLYIEPFVDYASKGSKVELAGKEKVGSADAYKLVLTNKDNISTTYYFDVSTWYVLKAVKKNNLMGQEMEITSTFSDFTKSDFGIIIPYSTEMDFGGQFQMTSKVNKAEFNQPVDAAIFEMKK